MKHFKFDKELRNRNQRRFEVVAKLKFRSLYLQNWNFYYKRGGSELSARF